MNNREKRKRERKGKSKEKRTCSRQQGDDREGIGRGHRAPAIGSRGRCAKKKKSVRYVRCKSCYDVFVERRQLIRERVSCLFCCQMQRTRSEKVVEQD